MPMTADEARRRLTEAGVLDRDVVLPGDPPISPRQGAVRVVHGDGGWEVVSEDYGRRTLLARTSDEAEALEYVVERLTAPLPPPMAYPRERLKQQYEAMAQMVAPIAATLAQRPGVTVETQLPEGAVVDRIGTLDGSLLYAVGTPLAARSLPPDVLDERVPNHGVVYFGVATPIPVLAKLATPWFEQPGGAVVFALNGEDSTVRDAVRRGALRQLHITDEPAAV